MLTILFKLFFDLENFLDSDLGGICFFYLILNRTLILNNVKY